MNDVDWFFAEFILRYPAEDRVAIATEILVAELETASTDQLANMLSDREALEDCLRNCRASKREKD